VPRAEHTQRRASKGLQVRRISSNSVRQDAVNNSARDHVLPSQCRVDTMEMMLRLLDVEAVNTSKPFYTGHA
jgi:hypothetical protein